MIIQIDAARPRRRTGLLILVRASLAPLFHRKRTERRAPSIHHMNDHMRRDVGLTP